VRLKSHLIAGIAGILISCAIYAQNSGVIERSAPVASVGKAAPEIKAPSVVLGGPGAIAATPRTILPGVGVMPGKPDYFKPVILRSDGMRTEFADVAIGFSNVISTPFPAAKIMDQTRAETSQNGQNLFYQPDSSEPRTVFITGTGTNDPVISITLTPRQIPSQRIIVQLDKGVLGVGEEEKPANEVYSDNIRYLFRQMALGRVPAGFSAADLPKGMASIRGLTISPQSRYSGSGKDIFVYQVENTTGAVMNLQENAFYQKGVRAVSFFPKASLEPRESTVVYVLSDKLGE